MRWKLKRPDIDAPEALPHFAIGSVVSLDDVMDFDRKICAMGCKRFMREVTAMDFPQSVLEAERPKGYTQVVVQEVRPGVRTRSLVKGIIIKREDIPRDAQCN